MKIAEKKVNIYIPQDKLRKINQFIDEYKINSIIKNNLTMIVCKADSPSEKNRILLEFINLINKYHIYPLEVIDRKNEVIQVFENLQKKYESIMLEKMAPQKRRTPAL